MASSRRAFSALRVVSAATGDGSLLLLVAARPPRPRPTTRRRRRGRHRPERRAGARRGGAGLDRVRGRRLDPPGRARALQGGRRLSGSRRPATRPRPARRRRTAPRRDERASSIPPRRRARAPACTRSSTRLSAMPIRVVISDFGGVLTTPLIGSFMAFQDRTGITGESLGQAMQRIYERDGDASALRAREGAVDRGRVPRDPAHRARGRARPRARDARLQGDLLRGPGAEHADDPRDARGQARAATGWRCSRTTSASGSRSGARCCRSTRSSSWWWTPPSSGCGSPSPRSTGSRSSACARTIRTSWASSSSRSACSSTTSRSTAPPPASSGSKSIHFRDNDQAIPEIREALTP